MGEASRMDEVSRMDEEDIRMGMGMEQVRVPAIV